MFIGKVQACKQVLFRAIRSPGHYFDSAWDAARKYCFALIFLAIVTAKLLHIWSHLNSLPPSKLLVWGPTFLFQDVLFITIARLLTRSFHWRWARIFAASLIVPVSLLVSSMTSANMSFYIVTGAEIHWRQAHSFHTDAAAIRTLLTGLTGFIIVDLIMLAAAYFLTPHLHRGVGGILKIWTTSIAALWCCRRKKTPLPDPEMYEQLARDDYEDDKSDDGDSNMLLGGAPKEVKKEQEPGISLLKRALILIPTFIIVILRCVRPPEPAFAFLSKTLVLTPFGGKVHHRALIALPSSLPGNFGWLGENTALSWPPTFAWLPPNPMAGFTDWYPETGDGPNHDPVHYDPSFDPLHISNLKHDVIEPLREALHSGEVPIKHVILIKLESTRQDVFPLRKDTYTVDRISKSYSHGEIPEEVQARLANLTRTAERLTGHPSGFGRHEDYKNPYGGISATNSHTLGTYTLKSVTGTVCGVTPLVADFNREYKYHIYQPCLPQIFDTLASTRESKDTDDFRSWPWDSVWMQSVTNSYDNQDLLTPVLGFNHSITRETIDKEYERRGEKKPESVNYYGYPDNILHNHIKDAFTKAENEHERLFLTYLTGITHHPWGMPNENYSEMMGQTWYGLNNDLNHYLNTIGFVDKWLAEILDILEETGVRNETLLVMTGDHGVSLPNDGGVTPYDNPHIGNFHVPLVFSHPKLPQVEVNDPVSSLQVLPTILDLLIESASLDKGSEKAVQDLLQIYEGQSLIRPLIAEEEHKKNWQFTVMNTGGTWLAVRSATKPYRLVIPLVPDVEWRFTNLDTDPYEEHHMMEFDMLTLLDAVKTREGEGAVDWINEAAHVSQWFLGENWRRWKFGQDTSKDNKNSDSPDFEHPPEFDDDEDHPHGPGHSQYHGPDEGPNRAPEEEKKTTTTASSTTSTAKP